MENKEITKSKVSKVSPESKVSPASPANPASSSKQVGSDGPVGSASKIGKATKYIKGSAKSSEDIKLTDKQKAFCIEYLRTLDPAKSYQRINGCKLSSAYTSSYRFLKRDDIRDYIDLYLKESSEISREVGDKKVKLMMDDRAALARELYELAYSPAFRASPNKWDAILLLGRSNGLINEGLISQEYKEEIGFIDLEKAKPTEPTKSTVGQDNSVNKVSPGISTNSIEKPKWMK